jgi:ammonia channel protein AmtB
VVVYAPVAHWLTIGLRCDDDEETAGLDLSQHAETAYSFGELGTMGRTG